MALDEMLRQQRAIARDRRVARLEGKRKFSLLLSDISVHPPAIDRNRSKMRCLVMSLGERKAPAARSGGRPALCAAPSKSVGIFL